MSSFWFVPNRGKPSFFPVLTLIAAVCSLRQFCRLLIQSSAEQRNTTCYDLGTRMTQYCRPRCRCPSTWWLGIRNCSSNKLPAWVNHDHSSPRNARCWSEAKSWLSSVKPDSITDFWRSIESLITPNLRWSSIGGTGIRSVFNLTPNLKCRILIRIQAD